MRSWYSLTTEAQRDEYRKKHREYERARRKDGAIGNRMRAVRMRNYHNPETKAGTLEKRNDKYRSDMSDPTKRAKIKGYRSRVWHTQIKNDPRLRRDRASYRLRRKYGITVDQWERMFERQGRRCALCRTDKPIHTRHPWHTDHDHATGEVRGVLCNSCNRRLGVYEMMNRTLGADVIKSYLSGWPIPVDQAEAI